MLNDYILDYRDMAESGLVKTASAEDSGKYAVIIKVAEGLVGKFPVGTVEEINQSIYAIENNKHIPEPILKTAQYYVKNAAAVNGITVDWETSPRPRVVKEASFDKPKIKEFDTLDIRGDIISLDSGQNIKLAQELLLSSRNAINAYDMASMSTSVIKNAEDFPDIQISPILQAYSNAELGDKLAHEINVRVNAYPENKEMVDALSKIACMIRDADPLAIIEAIRAIDKTAGFDVDKRGLNYASILQNNIEEEKVIDHQMVEKVASCSSSPEDEEFLSRIL